MKYHKANKKHWDRISSDWARMHDRRGDWQKVHNQPHLVFLDRELEILGPVDNQNVCVLGSGDNLAVFALAGMGANVTSVDISPEQLKTASKRADSLGLEVKFIEADVANLNSLGDEEFDIVYTGGHVAVWVSNLRKYYKEAVRILREDGLIIVNEYHPFRRIWKEKEDSLEIAFNYFEDGPHEFNGLGNMYKDENSSDEHYEFHWTLSQFYNSIAQQGVEIFCFEEIGDNAEGWEIPPMEGLPQMLLLAGNKKG